ncbi:MAG: HD-GYP domain-containing protein [Acidothermus cellulolyticus]|nr:HD-GYP domain-containing protein [Acidothermus cellulolyticus]
MRSLPRAAALYTSAMLLAGGLICAQALLHIRSSWSLVVPLVAICWIGEIAPVQSRLRSLSISMGFPVDLAAVFLGGPWVAALVATIGSGTQLVSLRWYKRLFNAAQIGVSAFVAGLVYRQLPGASVGFADPRFPHVLPAVIVTGLVLAVLNYSFVATAIALAERLPIGRIWWGGMSETLLPSMGYGFIGLAIAVVWASGVGVLAGVLVLAPMLAARWAFQQYGAQHAAYEATVASLIQAVETKDYYTRGHSERVARAAVMIGRRLGMREDRLEMLRYAGMLHDVGKLGVPTRLLQKTGPLDAAEFSAIKLHSVRGCEVIGDIEFLGEAAKGIRHHHERMDGLGYPDGLAGDAIPEFARIIAVADAFDSMTSTRSYRAARSVEAAITELRRWSGTQFDPVMVEALIAALQEEGWTPAAPPAGVAPAALLFGDHDDPASQVAAVLQPVVERVS